MVPPQMRTFAFAVLTLLLVSGCSDTTQPQRVPSTLALSQTVVSLDGGTTAQLTASLLDQHGEPFETPPAGFVVQWASNDNTVASVDASGLVSGNQPGATLVTATAGTLSASAQVMVNEAVACRPAASVAAEIVNLRVGEQLIVRDPASFCLQFAPSTGAEAYLIGVQSVSEAVSSVTPVVFGAVAASSTAGISPPLPLEARARAAAAAAVPTLSPAQIARRERHTAVEMRLRQWERQNLGARMREALGRQPRPAGDRILAVPPNVQVGDTVPIRFPNINRQDFCRDFIAIQTVVRRVGARGIWLEDVANPAGGFTGPDFTTLSDFFDGTVYGTITDYFGAPTDDDGNGKIIIVATREVNRAGPAGFVVSTDFYPRTACPSSNEGEIYYSEVPDPQGAVGAARSAADVLEFAHIVIPHELTHLIQFGRRLSTPGATTVASLWEMEGQATLAEEIMGHAISGRSPRNNYGAAVALNNPPSTVFDWYVTGFVGLAQYYGFRSRTEQAQNAPEQCSWFGRLEDQPGSSCGGSGPVYGTSWSFLRWLSDHHGPRFPGGEKGLHQALIVNHFAGFRTIEEVIGTPIDSLLAQWAAMLYVDDRVPGAAAPLTLPSWNLFDFEQSVVETARLTPRQRSFSTFTDQVSVRAGATAYFRVSGGSRPATAIRALGSASDPLPEHMRLWVVRLQ